MANRIILRGDPDDVQEAALEASVDITPGMLIENTSTGTVKPHATAAGNASPKFAIENALIGDGIDDAYTEDGENVLFVFCERGDQVYALLKTGNNVAIGDLLVSAGDGSLQKYAAQTVNEGGSATDTIVPGVIVGRALEAVNNTSGSNERITIEVF